MKILIYCPNQEIRAGLVEALSGMHLRNLSIDLHPTLESFRRRLVRPIPAGSTVIVVPTSQEIEELLTVGDFLWNLRLIVILPDSDGKTLDKVHRLRPRFIAYPEETPQHIASVLTRMTRVTASIAATDHPKRKARASLGKGTEEISAVSKGETFHVSPTSS